MNQAQIFMDGEADAWHQRNASQGGKLDRVVHSLYIQDITPNEVIEIGCGDGFRLNMLHADYECRCYGLEPSRNAIRKGQEKYPHIQFWNGTARDLKWFYRADLIIFGFCLYVVDREDIPKIVSEADAILMDGGHIVIHDFDQETPQAVPYKHKDGVYSYKMDHSKLWLANPAYELVSKTPTAEGESVTIIQKKGWNRWRV